METSTKNQLKDVIVEAINLKFQDVVDEYYMELRAHVTAAELTCKYMPKESNRPFAALKVAIESLIDMMQEHEIEDLTFRHSFKPEFDWCPIKFNNYQERFHDTIEYDWTSTEYIKDLYWLQDKGYIGNLVVIGEDTNFVVARFTLKEFNSKVWEGFDQHYNFLKQDLKYFGLDVS